MSEIKELIEQLNKAHKEFRDSMEERVQQLEKGGTVDPQLQEKIDTANNHITTLEQQIEEEKGAQKRIDDLELQVNRAGLGGIGDKDTDLHAEARQFYAQKLGRPAEDGEVDVEAYSAYKQAFDKYLRYGDRALNSDIRNALSVGSDPDGGQWVPASTTNRIIQRLFETSPVRQVANVITIGTDRFEIPKDVNEATSGGWVGETQSRDSTGTPEVGMQEIPVHEQYAMPEITQKLVDDAGIDIEGWLSDKISDILIRTENTAFVNGNGVMKPRGFMDYTGSAVTTEDGSRPWGVLQYIATGANGSFPSAGSGSANSLIEIISKMKSQLRGGSVFCMNRFVKAVIRKLRDSNDNYYLIPDLSGGGNTTLLGFPVVEMDDMPDMGSGSNFPIAFGNFNEAYQIVDRLGIRVLRDPYTNKPYIRYYTTKRVGADVTGFDSLKLLKASS